MATHLKHALVDALGEETQGARRMTMQVIAAVAEFERDLLTERTHAGISRAKKAGKRFGRPPSLTVLERGRDIARPGPWLSPNCRHDYGLAVQGVATASTTGTAPVRSS